MDWAVVHDNLTRLFGIHRVSSGINADYYRYFTFEKGPRDVFALTLEPRTVRHMETLDNQAATVYMAFKFLSERLVRWDGYYSSYDDAANIVGEMFYFSRSSSSFPRSGSVSLRFVSDTQNIVLNFNVDMMAGLYNRSRRLMLERVATDLLVHLLENNS